MEMTWNKFQKKHKNKKDEVEIKNWKSSVFYSGSYCKLFADLSHSWSFFEFVLMKLCVQKTQNMLLDIFHLHLLNLLYIWTYLLDQSHWVLSHL